MFRADVRIRRYDICIRWLVCLQIHRARGGNRHAAVRRKRSARSGAHPGIRKTTECDVKRAMYAHGPESDRRRAPARLSPARQFIVTLELRTESGLGLRRQSLLERPIAGTIEHEEAHWPLSLAISLRDTTLSEYISETDGVSNGVGHQKPRCEGNGFCVTAAGVKPSGSEFDRAVSFSVPCLPTLRRNEHYLQCSPSY